MVHDETSIWRLLSIASTWHDPFVADSGELASDIQKLSGKKPTLEVSAFLREHLGGEPVVAALSGAVRLQAAWLILTPRL
jgi:hypothetical protein